MRCWVPGQIISALVSHHKHRHRDRERERSGVNNVQCLITMAPLSIPEDRCPLTGPWYAQTGPRTGFLGNGKRTH